MDQELPVPDWVRVFDVAPVPLVLLTPDLVSFLVSDRAGFVSGQVIYVAGGPRA